MPRSRSWNAKPTFSLQMCNEQRNCTRALKAHKQVVQRTVPLARMGHPPGAASDKPQPRFARDADDRSIFITGLPKQNETPEEVAAFFADCGPINKCTLIKDRATQQLKGAAYVEFQTNEGRGRALDTKQNALFRGQHPITVCTLASVQTLFSSPLLPPH